MKRRLGIVDGSPYGFLVELEGPNVQKDESTKQQLVPRMKKLPSKVRNYIQNLLKLENVLSICLVITVYLILSQMFRSFVLDKDFDVSLAYESEDILPPGTTSPVFAQYSISGLADAAEK